MREAQPAHVLGQSWRDLAIAERAISFLGNARPRAQVDLVDQHRLVQHIPVPLTGAPVHPRVVFPVVGIFFLHDRRGAGRLLELEREGIGLDADHPFGGKHLVLVERAWLDLGDEQLVHAARAHRSHRKDAAIPTAEIADDADASRVRRPDGEAHPRDAVDGAHVRAQLLREAAVRPLAEEVEIDLAKGRQESIGIVALPRGAIREMEAQAVAHRDGRSRDEATVDVHEPWRDDIERHHALVVEHGFDGGRVRHDRTDDDAALTAHRQRVRAEHVVRLRVLAGGESREIARGRQQCLPRRRRHGPRAWLCGFGLVGSFHQRVTMWRQFVLRIDGQRRGSRFGLVSGLRRRTRSRFLGRRTRRTLHGRASRGLARRRLLRLRVIATGVRARLGFPSLR